MAITNQIKVYLIKYLFISFNISLYIYRFTYHISLKTFLVYIVSNEDQEERARNQTTVAVILVIAWCLVAIVAFVYYKKTRTGIMNDILCLEYSHVYFT